MATPNSQTQSPNMKPHIFYVSPHVMRVDDSSGYYALVTLSRPVDPADVKSVIKYAERVRVYSDSTLLLEVSFTEAHILIGTTAWGTKEYLRVHVDFGDDALPLGEYLSNLLSGKYSVKGYYTATLEYVRDVVNAVIRNLTEGDDA